ncbi:MAG: hypothetical protein A4E28_02850 [Methanocella sp. PtaU1.Bin125]|nr:MAG: hypothetical protein A4E28_02850 [Methanocella sp. PtaU1.Bin125]
MFGVDDPQIIVAYVIAIGCVIACVIYGFLKWNSDGDE